MAEPRYLPHDLVVELSDETAKIEDKDLAYRITRFVESAFAQGYDAGRLRGRVETLDRYHAHVERAAASSVDGGQTS